MIALVVAACLAGVAGEPDEFIDAGVEAAADASAPEEEAAEAPAAQEPPDAGVVEPEPPAAPPADAPLADAEKRDARPEFVKGELSVYLGSDRLTVKNTRIGVSAGIDRFEEAFYLLVEPLVDLRFLDGKLGIGVGVPLRFELFSFATNPATGAPFLTERIGRLRVEDYDSFHDFGRILKYVTFGRKEDQVYVNAGQRYASSIGHGAITRRYSPNIDIDYPRASAQVDMYNEHAGFEFMTNDLLQWNQLSALAFVKPLSFFKPEHLMAKTFSVGVTGALDWGAPWALRLDPMTQTRLLEPRDNRLQADTRAAALLGFDAEVKVVKTANVDLKPYVDYSMLLGGDGGLTLGVLGRFNVGEGTVHAFRLIAEARYLGSRYQPSYFDTFYEIDRFAYLTRDFRAPGSPQADFRPKHRYLLETGLGERFGYYVEGSWGVRNVVGLTLALEGTSNSRAANFVAHLELPVLSFLQLFGSYYLRGVESFDELGLDANRGVLGLFGDKAIAFAGARLQILPFLFVNGRFYKTFRMNPDLQRYDNQLGFVVDLEIGYEFKRGAAPPPPKAGGPRPSDGAAMSFRASR